MSHPNPIDVEELRLKLIELKLSKDWLAAYPGKKPRNAWWEIARDEVTMTLEEVLEFTQAQITAHTKAVLERLEAEAREYDTTDIDRYEHVNGTIPILLNISAITKEKEKLKHYE